MYVQYDTKEDIELRNYMIVTFVTCRVDYFSVSWLNDVLTRSTVFELLCLKMKIFVNSQYIVKK